MDAYIRNGPDSRAVEIVDALLDTSPTFVTGTSTP
jgi:hypothetical protein